MTDLPQPLTPADCNLTDFQFMPMDVHRLLTSETWVLGNGEEKAAAITLWLASWHQIPAGSIPKADRMLAHLSQAGSKWSRVKLHVLRGWVQATDGRLYHAVVAEKVLEAWIEKLANSLSGATGNAKRWGVVIDTDLTRAQFIEAVSMLRAIAPQSKTLKKKIVATIAAGSPPDSPPDLFNPSPPESPGDRKGQGQGQGQGLLTPKPEASRQASSVVGDDLPIELPEEPPAPPAAAPPLTVGRNVAISILLRAGGIDATSANPLVCLDWAQNPKVTDELLELAVVKARTAKPDQARIHVNYLKNIVAELLLAAGPKAKSDDRAWRMSDGGIERKGREMGMFARGGESHRDFAGRIDDEIRKRKGSGK